ncbi:MAG: insulinase family protein [Nanoarchaeota archaeon]|nr:insulinase family protein [Nanoarchaeota archaeon]
MKFDFKRKVLKNGMTVILEKRNLPVVSVAFAVRAGGINESLEEKGISHFIEHMLYKGTSTRSAKQIASEIEKNGGDLNGFTGETMAVYLCKIPSEHVKIALEVLSDMVKNPLLDGKELEKERKVIFEEIKMYHDNPIRYVFDEMQENLYDGTMGVSLIGTSDTMNSIDREKMAEKFKQIYQPNNMILCVVGNADFEELVKFAEENFGDEKGEIPEQKFNLKNGEKIEERKGIDQANLVFAYHIPLAEDKKNYAAQVLITMMADGLSSRLFQEIREKRNLAYAIKGGSEITKNYAHSFIYVGTMKKNVELVKKLILEEFKKVAESLDEKELNELKKQIIGNYKISMEDSQVQMVNLLSYEVGGRVEEFYEFEKNIQGVHLADVKELAEKASKEFSFFALVPED